MDTRNLVNRLLHYQSVGHSNSNPATGRVSERVCDPIVGYQRLIDSTLEIIYKEAGRGWDIWMHNIGGIWRIPHSGPAPMLFEQMDIAKTKHPALWKSLPLLKHWCDKRRIAMRGYIGYPRSDGQAPRDQPKTPHPEFSQGDLSKYYPIEFISFGHDWTAHVKKTGTQYYNFKWLRKRDVSIYLEAMPLRKSPWLLGENVVATESMWWRSEQNKDRFFSEAEINKAGGHTIHLVLEPDRLDPVRNESDYELQAWKYEISLKLLRQGKTVAVNLHGLAIDHEIWKLVMASKSSMIDKIVYALNNYSYKKLIYAISNG